MNSNDILQCIFILIIFGLLFLVNILSVGIKNIENNWPTYRCNPVVMPFAGLFGQDVISNFTYCIQNIQSSYLSYLTLPMNYNLNIIGNLGGSLTTQIQSLRSFIDNLRDSITSIIQNVFNVFLNMLVQLQLMIVTIKDMMAKMIGVTVTQLYLIMGFTDLLNSAYKGPPGQMVKALQGVCFHPNTIIETENGKYIISEIPLESKLTNGAIVQSRMVISNVKENGLYREDLYQIKGKGHDIIVSGSHLIYNPNLKKYSSVKEFLKKYPKYGKKTDLQSKELYCLITSNHTIPIDGWIFHDWEDNNGSNSKTLKT
tara:strand:+ start:838 stop:1779 length:942 start_codon:yes stop_codon:yes gene_type:complete